MVLHWPGGGACGQCVGISLTLLMYSVLVSEVQWGPSVSHFVLGFSQWYPLLVILGGGAKVRNNVRRHLCDITSHLVYLRRERSLWTFFLRTSGKTISCQVGQLVSFPWMYLFSVFFLVNTYSQKLSIFLHPFSLLTVI